MHFLHPAFSVSPRAAGISLFLVLAFFLDPVLEIGTERYVFLARAIAEKHEFRINQVMTRPQGDMSYREGNYYMCTEPGLGFLMAPVAAAIHSLGAEPGRFRDQLVLIASVLLFGALPTALLVPLWCNIFEALLVPRRRALLLSMGFLCGSHLLFYSTHLTEYPFAALGSTLIIRNLLLRKNRGLADEILIGGWLGLMTLLNLNIAFVNGIAVLFALPLRTLPKRFVLMAVAGAPFIALRLWYQDICFGSPFSLPYQWALFKGDAIAHEFARHATGPSKAKAILLNIPKVLWGITFSGNRGFIVHSPVFIALILSLRGSLPKFREPRFRAAALGSVAVLPFLVTMIDGVWEGGVGGGWGTRYLLPAIPFLMLLAGECRDKINDRLFLPLAYLSAFFSWIGLQYGHSEGLFNHIKLFLIGGPTFPLFRNVWLYWNEIPAIQNRLEHVNPNMKGYYYALTHPSPMIFYLGLACLIIATLFLFRDRNDK